MEDHIKQRFEDLGNSKMKTENFNPNKDIKRPNPQRDTLSDFITYTETVSNEIKNSYEKINNKKNEIRQLEQSIGFFDMELKRVSHEFAPYIENNEKKKSINNIVGMQELYKKDLKTYKYIMGKKNK